MTKTPEESSYCRSKAAKHSVKTRANDTKTSLNTEGDPNASEDSIDISPTTAERSRDTRNHFA